MKLVSVIGTRPQFIKMAPMSWYANTQKIDHKIINTGQHYSDNLAKVFLESLNVEKPQYEVNSDGHQIDFAEMISGVYSILNEIKPDKVIIYGDTNSTLAGAVCASTLGIPIAHVEAGLRSYDMQMPEERNRRAVDAISNFLFVHSDYAKETLLNEKNTGEIFVVGNLMEETLRNLLPEIKKKKAFLENEYFVCTIHRPSNVDNSERLSYIFNKLSESNLNIVLVEHPRLKKQIEKFRLEVPRNIQIIEPQEYLNFLGGVNMSKGVITDSGGLQNDALNLGVPVLVMRSSTEWREFGEGDNFLMDHKLEKLRMFSEFTKKTINENALRSMSTAKMIFDVLLAR